MRLRALFGLVVGLALSISLAPGARAASQTEGGVSARDPAAVDAYQIHEEVQRRLARLDDRSDQYQAALESARAILTSNDAERSKSPLLRYDLAYVHYELKDYARAAEIYRATIAAFPDHPMTERAWLQLAFACGHFGDNLCEREAYEKILRIETEDVYRMTPILNLAETMMHLGELKEAIEGYREALRLAGRFPSRETAPLATWGLAIALDRSGDRAGAEREAKFALDLERSMNLPNLLRSNLVFFVPQYEVEWYDGLRAIARARAATTARQASRAWADAEKHFGAYVAAAEPHKDRWVPIAKARLKQVLAEKARAEKKAGSEPPAPESTPDVSL
jgi:tetratricopeptide (TPR) repeat protein